MITASTRTGLPAAAPSLEPPPAGVALPRRAQAVRPRASVVVPTKDRPELLTTCLDALLGQRVDPRTFEIIVVDDGAFASGVTGAVISQASRLAAAKGGPAIRHLANTGPAGPAGARNTGWKAARAEIVAFTDDDCIPTPGWLAAGVAAFVDGVAGVSGRLVLPLPARPTDYERDAAHLAESEFVTANCFYRRSALEAAGGFDERFSMAWREDSDLYFTLLEQGRRLVREPEAIVVHPIREAPWGVSVRQQKKTAYNALLRAKHPWLYETTIKPSPFSYYPLTLGLVGAAALAAARRPRAAGGAGGIWLLGTLALTLKRLRGTRYDAGHVAEMLATSAVIPPVSLFWRWYGRIKFARSRP